MASDTATPGLPRNDGQFGEGRATEDCRPLPADDRPSPPPKPRNLDGSEVTPGPHQEQGGMRS